MSRRSIFALSSVYRPTMKAVYAAVLFIGIFGALTSATLFRKNFFLKTFRNVKTQTYCARPSYPSYGYAYVKDKTCTYYCYPGYTLVGYKVRYCIDGQWKGTVPRCTELRSESPLMVVVDIFGTPVYRMPAISASSAVRLGKLQKQQQRGSLLLPPRLQSCWSFKSSLF